MAYGRIWWLDATYLKQFNIEAYLNIMNNMVQFRKSFAFPGDAMLRYAHIAIDEYELKNSSIDITDVNRTLDNMINQDADFRHPGPTNAELRDPRLKHAWEEYIILKRLIGSGHGY